jgi:LGFP repeat
LPTNIGAFTVFGAIEQKWLALGGAKGLFGLPLSNEAPTFDGAGRAQTFKGGVVSWHPSIGAHEVHGAILARWLELGREKFGHPITDETPCPDNIGRFNHFQAIQFAGRPLSSIYWSPATGPHDVFGAIRDKWASMGFERSVLGYPQTSEADQPGGGKTQRFQGGVITWNNTGGAAEHEVSGDTVKFDSGQVNSNLPLNGNVQLIVQRNGTFTFTGSAHDSGFDNISYGIGAVLITAPGDAFEFKHSGHVEGTSAGLPFGTPQRDDHFVITGQNPVLTAKFDDIVKSGRLVATLTGTDKLQGALQDLLVEAAKEAVQAGIQVGVAAIAG